MRCLALAQAWQDAGGQATFAMANALPKLKTRLEAEKILLAGFDVQPGNTCDSEKTIRLSQDLGARWVVVDGYHFNSNFQRAIKNAGLNLLVVDDNAAVDHFYADIVMNQNLHSHENMYVNREPNTRLLLGTRYALLRREFLKWRGWKRELPSVARKVLVTLGGSDPDNVTLKVIEALQQVNVDGLEAVVVIGPANPHYQEIQTAACTSRFPIRLERNVTDMPELMAWADVAVSGAGSTSWELAFMGLPSTVMVLGENQLRIAEQLQDANITINLGRAQNVTTREIAEVLSILSADQLKRTTMSERERESVDGKGAGRVTGFLNRLTLRGG